MPIEQEISDLLLRFAKLEFYLINKNSEFARTESIGKMTKITGFDWQKVAPVIQDKASFQCYDFKNSPFKILKDEPPQFLTITQDCNKKIKWDSDDTPINSWDRFLTRSVAQIRNNIAHGNKAHIPAPFTADRTQKYIAAVNEFFEFLMEDIFDDKHWETPIIFR
ncbi:MAG: hypothetical protein AB7S78_14090 [Candidatus Omnitrophota bacterium]